jgi:hypothetical protein
MKLRVPHLWRDGHAPLIVAATEAEKGTIDG